MALTGEKPAAGARPSRRQLANAIRVLAMDAVQQANSGHPGMPMGMADIAEVLWNDFLKFNPSNPRWSNRDRFVLSNGHGSMLLYAVAHLTGYGLDLEEIAHFRQLGYRTAGHPEHDLDIGIETTTGPLGQGLANAVGMALAEKVLAATFNRPGHEIVDHSTYVFVGDGCLMEGVSHEACSLAGALGLGKLVAIYDDNGISIDGRVTGWFRDDTPARFRAYGWHVVEAVDGHDPEAIARALAAARAEQARPSLVCCKTVIGWGAPHKQGTAATHGEALGAAEVAATREHLGWGEPPFVIPQAIETAWDARARGSRLEQEWQQRFDGYASAHPELAAEYQRRVQGELPRDWAQRSRELLAEVAREAKEMATRKASQRALDGLAPLLPELFGGSADLTGSNNTFHSRSRAISDSCADGNYVHYGVREFGMAAITNGMSLHGGFIPYSGTFLVFCDYARNALRMAALMRQRNIFVFTHDSIGLGEDGPTHQPIEQLAGLRATPNFWVWRPCDGAETVAAWSASIGRSDGPSALVLSRQNLPPQERTEQQLDAIRRGAYVLRDCEGEPELVLIATGSEVALAMSAQQELVRCAIRARLVSMPCMEAFEQEPASYRDQVLPGGAQRVAVEAAASASWWRYVGRDGAVIGIDRFGESAPAAALFPHFGFSVENIVGAARGVLGRARRR